MEDGNADAGKGAWVDLFRGDRALYSALVIGGIALHATQILVIAIILPTIVADIGGVLRLGGDAVHDWCDRRRGIDGPDVGALRGTQELCVGCRRLRCGHNGLRAGT
jgi:hypothetical protein